MLADVHGNSGTVLFDVGDFGGARREFEQSIAAWEKAYGPDHPRMGCASMASSSTRITAGSSGLPSLALGA